MSEEIGEAVSTEGCRPETAPVPAITASPAGRITHFGDPCIHCGLTMDEFEPGDCKGEGKRRVIGYASLGVRPDGVESYRYRLSDNTVREAMHHISFHAPYYHFGASDDLINPPPYDMRLKAPRP